MAPARAAVPALAVGCALTVPVASPRCSSPRRLSHRSFELTALLPGQSRLHLEVWDFTLLSENLIGGTTIGWDVAQVGPSAVPVSIPSSSFHVIAPTLSVNLEKCSCTAGGYLPLERTARGTRQTAAT